MDVLKAMTIFTEVARQRSFAAAARALGLSTSSVSRHVLELEAWVGVDLLQRTTRSLSLTQDGALFLAECRTVLEDVDRLRDSAGAGHASPSGVLRITAPVFLAKVCVHRLLPDFLSRHPKVRIELSALDRMVDLVEERFDIAIRVGELSDSSLIARGLRDIPLVVIASPAYLETHGAPASAAELKAHNCIVDTAARFSNRWPIVTGDHPHGVKVSGNVKVNNGEIARDLACQGMGLALLPEFFVRDQLAAGTLVEVLAGQVDSKVGLFLVYPKRTQVSARVRAFVDYAVEYFTAPRD